MKSSTISQNKSVRTLQQHDYTCQACGADASDVGSKSKMRVGFIPRNNASLALSDAELKMLCPDCDDGFATAKLLPRMTAKDLQKEICRATVSNGFAALDWLLKEYPKRLNSAARLRPEI